MDNLPKDPPDSGNNNPTPASPVGGSPPFGTGFDPHSNPIDPNNPLDHEVIASSAYSSQPQPPQNTVPQAPNFPNPSVPQKQAPLNLPNHPDNSQHSTYSEVAQHKMRDAHGRFIHSEHTVSPEPQTTLTSPNIPTSPNPPTSSNPVPTGTVLPPIIEINQNTEPSSKKDPPLFGFFITNPVTYLKAFLSRLLKRQMITLRIPVLALIIIMAGVGGGVGGFGLGVKTGINYALGKLFPNFSPILHRSITAQGTIQKSSNGYFLQANDKDKTLWTLNPVSANVNLAEFAGMRVQIKGNLTPTPNLIDVSEVISLEPIKATPLPGQLNL